MYMPSLPHLWYLLKNKVLLWDFMRYLEFKSIIGPILTYMIAQQFIHLEYIGFQLYYLLLRLYFLIV